MAGRYKQAKAIVTRVLGKAPGNPEANAAMAQLMMQQGDGTRALYFVERALASGPATSQMRCELARMLSLMGQRERGGAVLREAAAAEPGNALARGALGWHLLLEKRYSAAARELREALSLDPNNPGYTNDLAMALAYVGRAREGVDLLRRAAARHPGDLRLHSSLAFFLNYCEGIEPAEVFEAHRAFARTLASSSTRSGPPPPRPRDPERPLNVGFLSPDFVGHSVGYFIRAILEHMDPAQFRVACYSTLPDRPGELERRPPCRLFRKVYRCTDQELAEVIRGDATDILIELSGHTSGNRLPALRLRPAPVLVTYLGYPNTTGVHEVGVRLVDPLTDPPPAADALATERLVRLTPCFLCYTPPDDAPEAGPSSDSTAVTFGSFNALSKMTPGVVRLWARILGQTPGSRLLLKGAALSEPEVRADVASWFADAGVESSRLEMVAWAADHRAHMEMYGRVDIGLDPFPYNGTTTTADALWMGVPVITLVGRSHAGRVGLSMLSAAGLSELCAPNPDAYARLAVELAKDAERRARLRRTLRRQVSASVLCDGPGMGRRFGEALRAIWRERCSQP